MACNSTKSSQDAGPTSTDSARLPPDGGDEFNRLVFETSPYLKQHARNPVDWYPWGPEAFEKAAKEDKPIFLSIGYSTCHWCHVMAHESFEDSEVAALLNQSFVSIKLDREERPDIDHVYMAVCQAMTGSGGWPLTVVMTPDKKPFFAGTYYPKTSQYGRPGLLDLLGQLQEAWTKERGKVMHSASEIVAHMKARPPTADGIKLTQTELKACFAQYAASFDSRWGGFGSAPKFPTPHNLSWLLRWWKRTGDAEALRMVETSLQEMAKGGIHDQLGGGFHRYATDARWIVPHFEKMLYDQAMLAMAYTEAFQATGKEIYREAARGIFSYVARDLGAPSGAFFSAEDADSEGLEGKFYVWRPEEIKKVLGEAEGALFCEFYDVTEEGNFHEPHGPSQHSILRIPTPLDDFAKAKGLSSATLGNRLLAGRRKLLEIRNQRIRPGLDDKVLTDWNGLMIAALAKASRAFDEPEYLRQAESCAKFILTTMKSEGYLWHRYGQGQAGVHGFLDDYAFTVWGLIELYQASRNPQHLAAALELHEDMVRHCWDPEDKSFRMSSKDGESLFMTPREIYDGAYPSGNSVAALNALRLSRLTGNVKLVTQAEGVMDAFASEVARAPSAHSMLMMALDFALGPTKEVVIAGDLASPETHDMFRLVDRAFLPHAVLLHHPLHPEGSTQIVKLCPFIKDQVAQGGRATAYLCEGFACQAPTTDIHQLITLLR